MIINTMPHTGNSGTTGHKIISIVPNISSKISTTVPARIIVNLANIPTILEISLSKNCAIFASSASLPDAPAEICLNGLNKVLNMSPIENKSAVSPSLVFSPLKNTPHPRKYHHCSRSTINIIKLYHKRLIFNIF